MTSWVFERLLLIGSTLSQQRSPRKLWWASVHCPLGNFPVGFLKIPFCCPSCIWNHWVRLWGDATWLCGVRCHRYADDMQVYFSLSSNIGPGVSVLNWSWLQLGIGCRWINWSWIQTRQKWGSWPASWSGAWRIGTLIIDGIQPLHVTTALGYFGSFFASGFLGCGSG